jgi:hypothetical protein
MKKQFIFLMSLFLLVISTGMVNAFTIDSVSGQWSGVTEGNSQVIDGIGTNQLTWGADNISSLEFIGNTDITLDTGDMFALGTLTHSNMVNAIGDSPSAADLTVNLSFSDPVAVDEIIQFAFTIDATPNTAMPLTDPFNNDIIGFETFEIEGVAYTLELLGFGYDENSLLNHLDTQETLSNTTQLWAKVYSSPVPAPAAVVLLGSGLLGLFGFIRKKE